MHPDRKYHFEWFPKDEAPPAFCELPKQRNSTRFGRPKNFSDDIEARFEQECSRFSFCSKLQTCQNGFDAIVDVLLALKIVVNYKKFLGRLGNVVFVLLVQFSKIVQVNICFGRPSSFVDPFQTNFGIRLQINDNS